MTKHEKIKQWEEERANYRRSHLAFTEQQLEKFEQSVKSARAFITKHSKALNRPDWSWSLCYTTDKISFSAIGWWGNVEPEDRIPWKPKEIAAYFGKDGWKREADPTCCGVIDWAKSVDGITVVIEHAEAVKPKLIEAVKL